MYPRILRITRNLRHEIFLVMETLSYLFHDIFILNGTDLNRCQHYIHIEFHKWLLIYLIFVYSLNNGCKYIYSQWNLSCIQREGVSIRQIFRKDTKSKETFFSLRKVNSISWNSSSIIHNESRQKYCVQWLLFV